MYILLGCREIWSFFPSNRWMSQCRIGFFYDHFIFNVVIITLYSFREEQDSKKRTN